MTTLYLSMSANEKDLEIEDDLAKGMMAVPKIRRSAANYS